MSFGVMRLADLSRGISARCIEVAKRDRGEPLAEEKVFKYFFDDALGPAVGIDRGGRMGFINRNLAGDSINGCTARKDQKFDVVFAKRFDEGQRSKNVIAIVFPRIAERLANIEMSGEMDGCDRLE